MFCDQEKNFSHVQKLQGFQCLYSYSLCGIKCNYSYNTLKIRLKKLFFGGKSMGMWVMHNYVMLFKCNLRFSNGFRFRRNPIHCEIIPVMIQIQQPCVWCPVSFIMSLIQQMELVDMQTIILCRSFIILV